MVDRQHGGTESGESSQPARTAAFDHSWHSMEGDVVLAALGSTLDGLSSSEARDRQARYGRNVIPEAPRKRLITVYLSQFRNAFIYLLMIAAIVSLVLGEVGDALFILIVLQINAIIGTYQEWQAHERLQELKTMVRATATVLRDSNWSNIDGRDLVIGDIIGIEAGVHAPAEVRLLSTTALEANESLLTGESVPVAKEAGGIFTAHTSIADRANMLHAGTTVLRGRGTGVVSATGPRTEVGRVAEALRYTEEIPPPLVRRMEQFTRVVATLMVGVILLIALVEIARGLPPEIIFLTAVALAVAAIPEGLPVALTVALSISVTRMARRNVIVRRLAAVEGLGACTLIAADKTGTLTQNELSVEVVHLPGLGDIQIDGGEIPPEARKPMDRLIVTGALCNESRLQDKPDGTTEVIGDTVDRALLLFARKTGANPADIEAAFPRKNRVPYDPALSFAASFNEDDGKLTAFVKGATEVVLPMCAGADRAAMTKAMERLAQDGYRVLAFAAGPVAEAREAALRDLEFLGLVALIDPLRSKAASAVKRCRHAGVAVRMITGDHPLTALAIARQLDLADGIEDLVNGRTLAALEDDQMAFDAVVARGRIFARIDPMQKLAIVQAMQRAGHTVAVTGDGINDAPALAAADLGVAMGRSGTDVARAASDLVVTDDDLSSIADGIEEGRIAYDNIRKVIYLLISTGAAEIALFMAAIAAGLPLPLSPVQLLWLNLVTQGIQDVALAFEKGEPRVLDRPPRPPKEGVFNRQMIEQSVISGLFVGGGGFAFFSWSLSVGWSTFEASNMLLLLLVLFENAHVFNCRSETRSAFSIPFGNNRFLVLGVIGVQSLHLAAMHIPGLNGVLDIAPVSVEHWLWAAGAALSVIVVMEGYKLVIGRRHTAAH